MKIAILLTTFLRDKLLKDTVNSILTNIPNNAILLIADQNPTTEKKDYYNNLLYCYYFPVPFDFGLSASRNLLVKKAKDYGCHLCLLGADSIQFTEQLKDLNVIEERLQDNQNLGIVGFNLNNRQTWEGDIDLLINYYFKIKQLDLEKSKHEIYKDLRFYSCSVVRNFFLAKTQCLLDNQWDEDLKLCEHEDFFIQLQWTKWLVEYCPDISGNYINDKPEEYLKYRQRMYNEFKQKLQKKYCISGWIKYEN